MKIKNEQFDEIEEKLLSQFNKQVAAANSSYDKNIQNSIAASNAMIAFCKIREERRKTELESKKTTIETKTIRR